MLVLWGIIPSMLFAQRQLSFQNGKFKIVQFTDLHWTSGSPKCAETERTIRTILKSENPDIAILTGDIVTEAPAINGWMSIIILLLQWQIRFCSIDTESKMSILQKLTPQPTATSQYSPKSLHR